MKHVENLVEEMVYEALSNAYFMDNQLSLESEAKMLVRKLKKNNLLNNNYEDKEA